MMSCAKGTLDKKQGNYVEFNVFTRGVNDPNILEIKEIKEDFCVPLPIACKCEGMINEFFKQKDSNIEQISEIRPTIDSENYEAELGCILRVAANAEFNFVQMTGVDNIPECAEKYVINVINNDDIIRIYAESCQILRKARIVITRDSL